MNAKVAIMNAASYEIAAILRAISQGLDALGVDLPRNARVLVKPNILSQNYPEQAVTTHPAIIEVLCGMLRDNGCAITIGESSAFYQPDHTRRGFETSGIADVARRFGAELVAFEEDGAKLYHRDDNAILKDVLLTRRLDETDFAINVPKLKTHAFFRMSGAVKNLLGMVPGGTKYEYHFIGGFKREDFGEKLADIAAVVKPYLTVMDAVVGLEGFGPAATGEPKRTGLILLSRNPFALDCAAARVIGVDPRSVKTAPAGVRRGLIPADCSFDTVGDHASPPEVPYRLPKESAEQDRDRNTLYKLTLVRPAIRARKCDGCGKCAEGCPFGAIAAGRPASIDYGRCLNCYYCRYTCPRGAISLKGNRAAPLIYLVRRIARI